MITPTRRSDFIQLKAYRKLPQSHRSVECLQTWQLPRVACVPSLSATPDLCVYMQPQAEPLAGQNLPPASERGCLPYLAMSHCTTLDETQVTCSASAASCVSNSLRLSLCRLVSNSKCCLLRLIEHTFVQPQFYVLHAEFGSSSPATGQSRMSVETGPHSGLQQAYFALTQSTSSQVSRGSLQGRHACTQESAAVNKVCGTGLRACRDSFVGSSHPGTSFKVPHRGQASPDCCSISCQCSTSKQVRPDCSP